ncbi:MAG: hypothetical protein JNK82_33500 [Myxococcaceae bacterium]|nr:hypothetical protein [Myxococcaceae bacterium]
MPADGQLEGLEGGDAEAMSPLEDLCPGRHPKLEPPDASPARPRVEGRGLLSRRALVGENLTRIGDARVVAI